MALHRLTPKILERVLLAVVAGQGEGRGALAGEVTSGLWFRRLGRCHGRNK